MKASTVTVDLAPAAPLAGIAAVNHYHRSALAAAESARAKAEEASHFALLCGTLLEDMQAAAPHGEWGKLFNNAGTRLIGSNDNHGCHFEFSSETARKYIEVAKRIRMERGMSGRAQKQLAAIASGPAIDEPAREFLNKLTKGQTLRQLYLDLDIITAPPKDKAPALPKIRKSTEQALLEDAREFFFTWREQFDRLVKNGCLDELDRPGLLEMKEFLALARDRVNARLK